MLFYAQFIWHCYKCNLLNRVPDGITMYVEQYTYLVSKQKLQRHNNRVVPNITYEH